MNRWIATLSSFAVIATVFACSSSPTQLKTDKDKTEADDDDDDEPLQTRQTSTPPPAPLGNVSDAGVDARSSCTAGANQDDPATCAQCCMQNDALAGFNACACNVGAKCQQACGGANGFCSGNMQDFDCILCIATSGCEISMDNVMTNMTQCLSSCGGNDNGGNGSPFPFNF